jgi:N-acetylmuramic acid 6-phosphate etherase
MIPVGDDAARSAERGSSEFEGLDTWPTAEVLQVLWESQVRAASAVQDALPALQRAVDAAVVRLGQVTGRLVYAGAGSSGMIAALDALELGATFNWPEDRTAVFLAGGFDLRRGPDVTAEDNVVGGRAAARDAVLGPSDVVLGISASGASPYTVAAIDEARARGAMTVAVASRGDSPLVRAADHAVVVATGDEVIAGSTRLAAGTAQKLVLNMFSTAVMIRLGFVYDNLMIEVRPGNAKLRQRRTAIVSAIARVEPAVAAEALERHGDVKRAVLGLAGMSDAEIESALTSAGGNLRTALGRPARARSDQR